MRKTFIQHVTVSFCLLLGIALVSGCAVFNRSSTSGDQAMEDGDSSGTTSYEEIVEDAVTDEGLFLVHKVDEEYYYEIPDSLLDRDMLLVSRIARTAENIGYGGEKLNTQVVRWQRREDNILLRHVSYQNVATDSLPVFQAVRNSNLEPIIASFSIETHNPDSTSSVIEVTSLYSNDIPSLGLQDSRRSSYGVRRLDGDRTFIEFIHSYPYNVEVRNLLTYEASDPPSNAATGTISLEINHSMVLLPDEPMETRAYDARVGYFSVQQTDYGSEAQEAEQVQHITRWKLVPSDKVAYLNGELSDPEEPIVYYIDPATPVKWRSYMKQGIEDWQVAFEAAGFSNAIIAMDPPAGDEDTEFSPEDIRYSVIRYFASPVQNAYGPHVHDPRTGQILESDIGWYHNVMSLLRNWFFVQTAAANPDARAVQFDDEVMGQLIRFVASHEVGHTLGLPHNWGSSYGYPVDSLRSPAFTSTHGTAPSIMDYARFNYIAQPGDGVTRFYPGIGEYDKWAIKWGYTWFPEDVTAEERRATLNDWVEERAGDPIYFYGAAGPQIDPRSQREDLGDNAMRAGELGMANLERITDNLIEWTRQDGENFEELEELFDNIAIQWNRYVGHVIQNVGGIYENDKTFGQDGPVYTFVPQEIQQEAMEWLVWYSFTTPEWLLNEQILSLINQASAVEQIRSYQESQLNQLLDPQRMGRIIEYDLRYEQDTYDLFEFMDDVRAGIWSELTGNNSIDVHRRNLQRAWIDRLGDLMVEDPASFNTGGSIDVSQSDIRPVIREQLELVREDITQAVGGASDRASRVHLIDAGFRIDDILEPEE